jgi:hypothetical protein
METSVAWETDKLAGPIIGLSTAPIRLLPGLALGRYANHHRSRPFTVQVHIAKEPSLVGAGSLNVYA